MNKFKGILAQSGNFSKLYLLIFKLFLLVVTTFFFTLVALLFWTLITGGDSIETSSLKILQLFQSIGMFVIPPLVLAYLWSEKPIAYLQLDKKTKGLNVLFVILFMILAIPFINLLGDLNQQLVLPESFAWLENWMKASEAQATQLTEKLLNVHSVQGLLFNILLIAMLPALGEELFFRGAIQNVFREWKGALTAIWITAIIFSTIHLQFYGFVPRLLLGAFFGYLLVWSGNLWLPVLAHFTNNAIAVIFYYMKNNGYQTIDIDAIGTGNTMWMGLVSAVLVITGIVWLRKHLQKTNYQSPVN